MIMKPVSRIFFFPSEFAPNLWLPQLDLWTSAVHVTAVICALAGLFLGLLNILSKHVYEAWCYNAAFEMWEKELAFQKEGILFE